MLQFYPCIFVTGFCGSTEMCQHGNASLLGGWMAHYLDHHFEYNPGLELLVTNMIQQDAIMEARCIYGNQLLAAVPLADKSNMDLTAKLCGMVMRFGQLGVFARVSLRSKGIVFCWSADGWDTEFDMLLQPSIQAFNATFSAFMTKIPSWGNCQQWVIWTCVWILGRVWDHECNGPTLHVLLWIDQPDSGFCGGYDLVSILVRG